MFPVVRGIPPSCLFAPWVLPGLFIYWFPLGVALSQELVERDNNHHQPWRRSFLPSSSNLVLFYRCVDYFLVIRDNLFSVHVHVTLGFNPCYFFQVLFIFVVHFLRVWPILVVRIPRCISGHSLPSAWTGCCACRSCLFSFFWAVAHSLLFLQYFCLPLSSLRASISFLALSDAFCLICAFGHESPFLFFELDYFLYPIFFLIVFEGFLCHSSFVLMTFSVSCFR